MRVHLGSMDRDLDNIARHFDKYPNFAIDTAARMRYLMLMPPKEVRVSHQVSGSCPLWHRSRFPPGRQSRRSLKTGSPATRVTGTSWQPAKRLTSGAGRYKD